MRKLVILVVLAVFWAAGLCFAQQQTAPPAQWGPFNAPQTVRPSLHQPTLALQPTQVPGNRLTFRDRRRLGLTFREVHQVLSEMQAAGEVEGKDSSLLAVEVMERLATDKPQEWSDMPADWQEFLDTVIAWLEKIIPLIIRIIGLFSQVMPTDGTQLCQAQPVAHPFCLA